MLSSAPAVGTSWRGYPQQLSHASAWWFCCLFMAQRGSEVVIDMGEGEWGWAVGVGSGSCPPEMLTGRCCPPACGSPPCMSPAAHWWCWSGSTQSLPLGCRSLTTSSVKRKSLTGWTTPRWRQVSGDFTDSLCGGWDGDVGGDPLSPSLQGNAETYPVSCGRENSPSSACHAAGVAAPCHGDEPCWKSNGSTSAPTSCTSLGSPWHQEPW